MKSKFNTCPLLIEENFFLELFTSFLESFEKKLARVAVAIRVKLCWFMNPKMLTDF